MTAGAAKVAPYAQAAGIFAFVYFTIAFGVPALRHDWSFPVSHAAALPYFADALSTWHTGGLGEPVLYPNQYLYFAAMAILSLALPPVVLLAALAAGIATVCVIAARLLAEVTGEPWTPIAVPYLALFNPWTYNELVAGHLTMLLGYAGLLLFGAALINPKRRTGALCAAVILSTQQLQFFLIAIVAAAAVWAARREWAPFAIALVLGMPVWIGVAFGYGALLSLPYTLPWQEGQSVPPLQGIALSGYYAGYDRVLQPLSTFCAWGLAATALAGFALDRRELRAKVVLAAGIFFLVAALGTRGPLPDLYRFAVVHVKASGIFRELYDVIGCVVIANLLLTAILIARVRKFGPVPLVIGALMLVTWCFAPPDRYWVAGATLPVLRVDASPQSRYAVTPAFQPLSYQRRGSGADPDLFEHPDGVLPLNQYLPSYPAVTALSRYTFLHDPSMLAGLSVSEIVDREGYCSDSSSLRVQLAATLDSSQLCGTALRTTHLAEAHELSIERSFRIASLTSTVGAGNVLVTDAARAGLADRVDLDVPSTSNASVDASREWVDAELSFLTNPRIGQPYGGVFTTSRESLAVRPGSDVLALVDGRLEDAQTGRIVTRTTKGFRWIDVAGARSLRCVGSCAVAAESRAAKMFPVDPPAGSFERAEFHRIVPWLVHATIPPIPARGLLRFNERYTPWWRAVTFGGTAPLRHVRVDGAVNGWAATAPFAGGDIWLLETRSLIEQVAEALAVVGVALIVAVDRRNKRREAP